METKNSCFYHSHELTVPQKPDRRELMSRRIERRLMRKTTTLPIAREIVATYVTNCAKLPWYIDLLNLNNHDYGP